MVSFGRSSHPPTISKDKLTRLVRDAVAARREALGVDSSEDGWTRQRCLVNEKDLDVLRTVLVDTFETEVDIRIGVDDMVVVDLALNRADANNVNALMRDLLPRGRLWLVITTAAAPSKKIKVRELTLEQQERALALRKQGIRIRDIRDQLGVMTAHLVAFFRRTLGTDYATELRAKKPRRRRG